MTRSNAKPAPASPSNNTAPSSRRVLLLDDDAKLNDLLKEVLEINSYSVTCVVNGVQGLREIMQHDFDIILCDMMMPGLAGDMFYLAVERVKPHLCPRFIFITGQRDDPKVEAFFHKISAMVLWKPLNMDAVLEKMASLPGGTPSAPAGSQGNRAPTGEWILDP